MERSLSKKLLLIVIKYNPWLIAVGYLFGSILAIFKIYSIILTNLIAVSFSSLILILCCSFALNFCICHRLPIYYTCIVDLINMYDYYFMIPIATGYLAFTYLGLFGITVLLCAYFKNKHNVRKRNVEKCTA